MSARYSRLNSGDTEEKYTVDFSSPFTYKSSMSDGQQYGSVFKYGKPTNVFITRGTGEMTALTKALHTAVMILAVIMLALTFPISLIFILKQMKSYERAVISRLGRIIGSKGPGTIMVIPLVDKIIRVDTRIKAFHVPPQKAMLADGALIEFGATVRYQIVDVELSVLSCQDLNHIMRMTAQTASVKYISGLKEKEVANANSINRDMKHELGKLFSTWGISACSYEISPTKVIVQMDQPDALSNVIGPIKQWLFGSEDSSPMAQAAGALERSMLDAAAGSSQFLPQATAAPQMADAPAHSAPSVDMATVRQLLSPEDLLKAVKVITNEQLVQDVNSVYKFEVDGESYFLDLKHGSGDCGNGEPPYGEADTTIALSLDNMQRMFTGSLKPFNAYMSGDIIISGDVSGAMKLDQLVDSISKMIPT